MSVPEIAGRENVLHRKHEVWKPPVFSESTSLAGRFVARIRRLLDLQAASLWQDMNSVLFQLSGTVVDVGCGAQPYRSLLRHDVKYIGIDTKAAGDFGYLHADTTYYEGTAFPVDSALADAALATETLEHVPDTGKFLKEIHRILKPDGICILTIPFSARWHYIPWDYYRFTPSGLNLVLLDAGFCDVKVYARGNSVTVAAYKFMAVFLSLCLGSFRGVLSTAAARIAGFFSLPLLVLAAVVGHLSLRCASGNDCLGYTVIARRNPVNTPM